MQTQEDWILLKKETRRKLADSAWIPLRASKSLNNNISVQDIGFTDDGFYCGSVAFPAQSRETAERLSWSDIGIGTTPGPYAFSDGRYKLASEYRYNDDVTDGYNFVFVSPSAPGFPPRWIIDPDILLALGLHKEGNNWVRPSEDYIDVIREHFDEKGHPVLFEIRNEFLIDYLCARNLDLKISSYMQRIVNFRDINETQFQINTNDEFDRDGGRFSIRVNSIDSIFGGQVSVFRVWHEDFDHEVDAPRIADEDESSSRHETSTHRRPTISGTRVESEFWRDEWVNRGSRSERVRGDRPLHFPNFIVATNGDTKSSNQLDYEDIGQWLWFNSAVVMNLIEKREFGLQWHTAETGSIISTSQIPIHFGINSSDLINIYAYDIARLPPWEQKIWASHNVAPQGGISKELSDAQVRVRPAKTKSAETKLEELTAEFGKHFEHIGIKILRQTPARPLEFGISRFHGYDERAILRLAKELTRYFLEHLDVDALRSAVGQHKDQKLGSLKLLEKLVSQKTDSETARRMTSILAGINELRIGDAHPTSSKIEESFKLAQIDRSASFLRQSEQLIDNCAYSIWSILRTFGYGEKS